jgi:beta-glucanase (GH16 family)
VDEGLKEQPGRKSTFGVLSFGACIIRLLSRVPPFLIVFVLVTSLSSLTQSQTAGSEKNWTLVWSDEFDQPNRSRPDSKKWVFDIGANGWGNHELEYYTDRRTNASVEKGKLIITAAREHYIGKDGVATEYTSARLKTLGKFSQTYGRFEARIRIPRGQGLWPAFWMLGDDIEKVDWPNCGEIDIMENKGKEPSIIHGTIHGPDYSGANGLSAQYTLPSSKRFADHFHLFAIEWEPDAIRFYVDKNLYATRTRAELRPNQKWVFDHPFFLLLNVAVGGDWPGDPDATTKFPQTMQIDYVRVYSRVSK